MCTWASTAGVAVSASSFLGRRGIWLYSELLEVASTLAYLSDRLCKVDCHNHSGTDFFRPAGRSQVIQQSGHMPEPTSQVMQPSSGGSSLNLCQLKYVFTLCVPSRQNSPLSRASDSNLHEIACFICPPLPPASLLYCILSLTFQ